MSHWKQVGPEWKTEDVFRVREILKCEHIPHKMPFSDVFFTSIFHTPAEDKQWGVLVRDKDLERVVDLLVREGLCDAEMLPAHRACPEPEPALAPAWPERVLTGPAKAV